MSTPSYDTYVQFIQDYENIKKGEVRCAIRHTDNPGTSMGTIGMPNPYKVWFDIYDTNIEDGYYAPRGTETILNNVLEQYVEDIFIIDDRVNKYRFKVQRKLKLKKLNDV